MFERFLAAFTVTDGDPVDLPSDASGPGGLMGAAGGRTFDHGLYRVHDPGSATAAEAWARAAFPEFADRVSCFGYDWLGRQFATDDLRGSPGDPHVLMLEPGTGEALEIPVPFSQFHDHELVDYTEEALARSFFSQWRQSGGNAPEATECVGYTVPLFLGGQDVVGNLELSDIGVYWTLMGQLRVQAMGLSEGRPIADVRRDR